MCYRESLRGIPPTLDHRRHAASKAVNVTVRSARPREYLTECEIDKLIDAACGPTIVGALGYTVDYVGARSSSCRILARVSIVSRCLYALICALGRWRYDKSSTHARSPIQRAPCPNCFADLLMLTS